MYKFYNIYILCFLFLVSCGRNSPSPVEIKIDEDYGYSNLESHEIGASIKQVQTSSATHIISGNETLFDVAYEYNIDPMNLAQVNNIKAPYRVKNGQVLRLPDDNPIKDSSAVAVMETVSVSDSDKSKNNTITQTQQQDSTKDRLDKEFENVILDKETSKNNKREASVNETALLSTPKITKPAINNSNGDERKTKKDFENKKAETKKSSKFIMPTHGKIIAKFGDMRDGFANEGLNIKAEKGTIVKAAADGIVIYVGNGLEEDYGNVVIVEHDSDFVTSYAHLDTISVKKDAKVRAGQQLGTVGKSGDVKEPQLYFEVMKNRVPVNPAKYL